MQIALRNFPVHPYRISNIEHWTWVSVFGICWVLVYSDRQRGADQKRQFHIHKVLSCMWKNFCHCDEHENQLRKHVQNICMRPNDGMHFMWFVIRLLLHSTHCLLLIPGFLQLFTIGSMKWISVFILHTFGISEGQIDVNTDCFIV